MLIRWKHISVLVQCKRWDLTRRVRPTVSSHGPGGGLFGAPGGGFGGQAGGAFGGSPPQAGGFGAGGFGQPAGGGGAAFGGFGPAEVFLGHQI
eukprot:g29166.t1